MNITFLLASVGAFKLGDLRGPTSNEDCATLSVPLVNIRNKQYLLQLEVNGSRFTAVPDTGSSEFIIPTDDCRHTGQCPPETDFLDPSSGRLVHPFKREILSMSRLESRPPRTDTDFVKRGARAPPISYGDGTTIKGSYGSLRQLQVAGEVLPSIDVLLVSNYNQGSSLVRIIPDAFLGLAPLYVSKDPILNKNKGRFGFLQSVFNSRPELNRTVGFIFSRQPQKLGKRPLEPYETWRRRILQGNGSFMILGAPTKGTRLPVPQGGVPRWIVDGKGITIDGNHVVERDIRFLVDTGASVTYLRGSLWDEFAAAAKSVGCSVAAAGPNRNDRVLSCGCPADGIGAWLLGSRGLGSLTVGFELITETGTMIFDISGADLMRVVSPGELSYLRGRCLINILRGGENMSVDVVLGLNFLRNNSPVFDLNSSSIWLS